MANTILFKTIYLPVNMGHGEARRKSLKECSNSLVALMDADDISKKDRFEKQIKMFIDKPFLSAVGGQITEFVGEPTNITGIRSVPRSHGEIMKYVKKRCPMNQVSVMFRKEHVEASGGYQDWYCEEDYYLWIRMIEKGFLFENVPDVLVNVRTGEEMAHRRGGWKYFSSEKKLQRYMLNKDLISFPQYLYNIAIRFGGEVIASDKMRQKLFSLTRTNKLPINSANRNAGEEKLHRNDIPPFSVSMCVYNGDNPKWIDEALHSVIDQTIRPTEIVLVIDGPISKDIQLVIDKFQAICSKSIMPETVCF